MRVENHAVVKKTELGKIVVHGLHWLRATFAQTLGREIKESSQLQHCA